MPIDKKELPGYVRRCYDSWRKANIHTREAEIERLRFYVGGELQWRDQEIQKRRADGRPFITVNRCKPAVDQIEGDVRLNPPGPQAKPVGDLHEDSVDADIIEGLIRECEYRSMAEVADSTAVRYSATSGYGVFELATEYCNDRDDQQQFVIRSIEDPHTVFFDPSSRMANRQDARWAGKVKLYSKDDYISEFGANRKVLQPSGVQMARGWLAEAFGTNSDLASVLAWTGARDGGNGAWRGPFLVCEFYMVETEMRKSRLYTDGIWRIDDEFVPDGVEPRKGAENVRESPARTIKKYLVDALEIHGETEWQGTIIPLFPVLGPEIYIEGKLHRLSVISGALDSNRALNYVATTATEIAGLTTKSPWIGYKGQFDDPRWQSANTEVFAYLEIEPTFLTDEQGRQTILPPPQRNQWEAPIQWLLALGAFFIDQIKGETSIYDPSLGQQKNDQSGRAIEQLRSESNVANFSYADNLHRAKTVMYQQMALMFPKIYTGPQVISIVRPDGQAEQVAINQEFPGGIDPKTGKKGKKNNIALGQFDVRVVAGPNYQTRQNEATDLLIQALKLNPGFMQNPAFAAKLLRLIGLGNPEIEGLADLLAPSQDNANDPAVLAQQNQQLTLQVQQLTQLVQRMDMEAKAELPKLLLEKYKADQQSKSKLDDNVVKLAIAEIQAQSQTAERVQADQLVNKELAQEAGLAAADRAHEAGMQASQHRQDQSMAQQAQNEQEEPVGANQ